MSKGNELADIRARAEKALTAWGATPNVREQSEALAVDVLALLSRLDTLSEQRAKDDDLIISQGRRMEAAVERALAAEAQVEALTEALRFYADPETYFGIGIFPDHPCGEFYEDISEVPWPDGGTNYKPGKRAREALSRVSRSEPAPHWPKHRHVGSPQTSDGAAPPVPEEQQ